MGNHYETDRYNFLFIFSEAHNKAVQIEKNDAKYPRIIIDETLLSYLSELTYLTETCLYEDDVDGQYCVDIYSVVRGMTTDDQRKLLNNIRIGIVRNLENNSTDEETVKKLKYFVAYHNRKVHAMNFPELAIYIAR